MDENYLIFSVDNQKFALPLAYISRVIWAAETTPSLYHSKQILGLINLEGSITPILNARILLNKVDKELTVSDQFIICELSDCKLGIWIDHVYEIVSVREKDKNNSIITTAEGELISLINIAPWIEIANYHQQESLSQ